MPTSNGQLHTKFILQGKGCFPLEFFAGVEAGLCPHDRQSTVNSFSTHLSIRAKLALPMHLQKELLFMHVSVLPTYMYVNHVCTLPMEVRR